MIDDMYLQRKQLLDEIERIVHDFYTGLPVAPMSRQSLINRLSFAVETFIPCEGDWNFEVSMGTEWKAETTV